MRQSILAPNHKEKFEDIIKLYDKIDKLIEKKGAKEGGEGFDIVTVGHEMMRVNSDFYTSVGDITKSFSTLCTEHDKKHPLAMSFLATMYSAWKFKGSPKEGFNVLEIGAGSCDLMNEILAISDDVILSPKSSEDHKAFFQSLKFNIVDFPQMIEIQRKKLGKNADKVNFIAKDISKELIGGTYDFIMGNEIPDTQRVEFLEVKIDEKTAEKKYSLRALKTTSSGDTSEVLAGITSSPEIIDEIGKNLYPIRELKPGVYKLQLGFHALMHNIKQSLNPKSGMFVLSDYYDFQKEFSSRDLTFAGKEGGSPNEEKKLVQIGEPGGQLIEAKKIYQQGMDVTYAPNVGRDTCDSFGFVVTNFDVDDKYIDDRSKVIINLKFQSDASVKEILGDSLFGKKMTSTIASVSRHDGELMSTELTSCSQLKKRLLPQQSEPSSGGGVSSREGGGGGISAAVVSTSSVAKKGGGR